MAGAGSLKNTIVGKLAATEGDLHTVASLTLRQIRKIVLSNTHASNVNQVKLYARLSGSASSYQLFDRKLQPGDIAIIETFDLDIGDKICGVATNADQVHYMISLHRESVL